MKNIKIKKKIVSLLILLFVFIKLIVAQPNYSENLKYWSYRYNLTQWFVMEGVETIDPATFGQFDKNSIAYGLPAGILFGEKGAKPSWGDTPLRLGWYMGVLATEYRLLKNNGQSTEKTEKELYYALKAFERIDRRLEINCAPFLDYYDEPDVKEKILREGGLRNGFFVRDDAFQLSPEFNKLYPVVKKQVSEALVRDSLAMKDAQLSDYYKTYYKTMNKNETWEPENFNYYMTIDQLAGLFIGFALINKCLDNNAEYDDGSRRGYNFKVEARKNVRLIMDYLASHNFTIVFPDGTETKFSGTKLFDKSGDKISVKTTLYGLVKAADYIIGEDYADYFEWSQGTNYAKYWNGVIYKTYLNSYTAQDLERAIGLATAAVGNSWYKRIPLTGVLNIFGDNAIAWLNNTDKELKKMGEKHNQEIFLLLNNYLHNTNKKCDERTITTYLATAPCHNPLITPRLNDGLSEDDKENEHIENPNFDARWYNCYNAGVNGWRMPNRWWQPRAAKSGGNKIGIFCGLDYMILYNLYHLVYDISPNYYVNKNNLVVSDAIVYSSPTNPAEDIIAYEDITINADITNTTIDVVTVQAGDAIDVKRTVNLKGDIDLKVDAIYACEIIDGGGIKKSMSQKKTTQEKKPLIENEEVSSNDYVPLETYLAGRTNTTPPVITRPESCLLYPNPAVSDFSLMIESNTEQEISINIYNNTKQNCKTISESLQKGQNTFNIAVSELQNGVYFVKVQTKDNYFIKKLIKK